MGPPAADLPPVPAADPSAGPRWPAALTAVAALLLAGWSPGQLSRLADLRVRIRRGDYAADGVTGQRRPPVTNSS
ncbi:MAG TPA: hypothetical protein VNK05_00265 [Chloroflexota bacterium]|nr:hypothetical protein [Chloroflexota bacterium]